MKDEYKDLTLWEALAVIQREAPVIRKTEEVSVETQKGQMRYNFAGLNTVWSAIADLMDDLGLIWTARTDILTLDGGQSRFVLRYRLVHLPSGEMEEGMYPLKGERPQEIGSSITYARRYALVAVLNLRVAEDDDDAQEAEERSQLSPSQQAQASRPPRKAAAKKAPARPRQAPTPMDDDARPTPKNPQAIATTDTRNKVFALVRGELGLTDRDHYLAYVNEVLAKHASGPVGSTNELTQEQAGWVIETAEKALEGPPPEAGQPAESEG